MGGAGVDLARTAAAFVSGEESVPDTAGLLVAVTDLSCY
jgi:hypothetical protein